MKNYNTISPEELQSFEKAKTATLLEYQDIFKRILIGYSAHLELYKLQEKLYDFDPSGKTKQTTIEIIERFKERIDMIDDILNSRDVNRILMFVN